MIRHLLNTEGKNIGKISGRDMAIEVDPSTMSLEYTTNGSVLLSAYASGILNPTILNQNIAVEGRLTKFVTSQYLNISSVALETYINDTYAKISDLSNYATLNYLETNFVTGGQLSVLLGDYATLSYLQSSYTNNSQLTTVLSAYTTMSYITDNYKNNSQLNIILNDYTTLIYLDANYYTKSYINLNLVTNSALTTKLNDYYTKTNINDNFYTKTNIDDNIYTITEVNDNFINKNKSGVANGVCPLDNGGKVEIGYLPSAIMTYEGLFNATTNTPVLNQPNTNTAYNAGAVFIVQNTTDPSTWNGIVLRNGDWLILNATNTWEKSENSDDLIISFNSRVGAVQPLVGDYSSFYPLKDDVYLKTATYSDIQIDNKLLLKQNVGDCYLKTETYSSAQVNTLLLDYVKSTTLTTSYYTSSYIDANFYTKSATDSLLTSYIPVSTTSTITGAKTFSNIATFQSAISGTYMGLSTTTNGVLTAFYGGAATNILGIGFSNGGSAPSPYYYFDFSNSQSDLHKFRFAVWRETSTQTQVQFFVSSDASATLANFMSFVRNQTDSYINIGFRMIIPHVDLTTGKISTAPSVDTSIVNRLYVTNTLLNYVALTGTQTIGGNKTFSLNTVFSSLTNFNAPVNITTSNSNPLVIQYITTTTALNMLNCQNLGSTVTNSDVSISNNDTFKFRTKLTKNSSTKSTLTYYLSSNFALNEVDDAFMSIVNDNTGGGGVVLKNYFTFNSEFENDCRVVGDFVCDSTAFLTAGSITIDPTSQFDIVNKKYVDNNFISNTTALSNYVTTAGVVQTISGDKIFTGADYFRGSMFLGNNNQFNINFTGRALILSQEDIYLLCQQANGLVRIGSEGGGANSGKLLIYRSCQIGLGGNDDNFRGNTYINNGIIDQWNRPDQIMVNKYINAHVANTYAQLITDYAINDNGDDRYKNRVAIERNGTNDIRIYNLLSDGTNVLLTYDETQRINGTITRYLKNSNVMLDTGKTISAKNLIPVLSSSAAQVLNTTFRWSPQRVTNSGNYISYVYRMENYDAYNYTSYKSFSPRQMSSNSGAGYYRVNYYSFINYGDAVVNNFSNIRFGISSTPPNLSTGVTGTLRFGLSDSTTSLPIQFNYQSRFYKSGGVWYKANTNLTSDNANPASINFIETKRYIYTCAWSYDYSAAYNSIFVTTAVTEYDTGINIFYDSKYLNLYNNNGAFLNTEISPIICITNTTDAVNLEILTNINPSWLSQMVGTSAGLTNAINVFDP